MSVFLIGMLTLQSNYLYGPLCYTLKLKTYQNIQPNSFCEAWVTLLAVRIIIYYYIYYYCYNPIPLSEMKQIKPKKLTSATMCFLLESVTVSDVVQHYYHVVCLSVNL